MFFSNFYHIPYTIKDIEEAASMKLMNNISKIRKEVELLIIDDNDFGPQEYLKNNGYSVHQTKDITTIKDVEPYHIILCDINGVGKKLGYDKEGAYLIKEIHNHYPSKRIIAYSSFTFVPEYNKYLSYADTIATKDQSIDDWIDLLDQQVGESINPVKQWIKIRNYLLQEQGISTLTIARLEDQYVKSINKRNPKSLQSFSCVDNTKIRSIITEFLSSLCAKIIFQAIMSGAQ